MQESTRRFLQRQLEKQFDNINFIKVRIKSTFMAILLRRKTLSERTFEQQSK